MADPKFSESSESLVVVLDGFEGPIDLLLTLARDQKVDLSKIAILPLAQQYLDFVTKAQDLDIELAADYLVMAAWLAYLKSRLLLPDSQLESVDDVLSMTDALKFQLLQLESMQKASQQLMARPRLGRERFANGQPQQFSLRETPQFTASLFDLLSAYGQLASREDAETLTIEAPRFFSIDDAVKRLNALIKHTSGWSDLRAFLPSGLQSPRDCRSALAAHFTASLELVRDGGLKLRQDSEFGTIYLSAADGQP